MTQPEHQDGACDETIHLPAELTIAQAGEFYLQLGERIEKGRDIVLDGVAVTRIDTAFIQLLFQVQRTLAETSHCIQWVNPSEAIRHSVGLLGMSEQLELAEAN